MKTANIRNLDNEQECVDFMRGARLARALGLSGPGCVRDGEAVLSYARMRVWGFDARKKGDLRACLEFERQADQIYMRIPEALRW